MERKGNARRMTIVVVVVLCVCGVCMPGAQNQVWKQLRVYKIILSFGVSPQNKISKSLALFRGHLLLIFEKISIIHGAFSVMRSTLPPIAMRKRNVEY